MWRSGRSQAGGCLAILLFLEEPEKKLAKSLLNHFPEKLIEKLNPSRQNYNVPDNFSFSMVVSLFKSNHEKD